MDTHGLILFAATIAVLFTVHTPADHWLQTSHQAVLKMEPGRAGRGACTGHVVTYTATVGLALAALNVVFAAGIGWWRIAAALALTAGTHYYADRGHGFRRLIDRAGSGGYVTGCTIVRNPDNPKPAERGPGTGWFHLDQAWHHGWFLPTALIIAA